MNSLPAPGLDHALALALGATAWLGCALRLVQPGVLARVFGGAGCGLAIAGAIQTAIGAVHG